MKKVIMTAIGGIVLTALIAIGGVSAQQSKHTGSILVKNDDEAGFPGMAKIPLDSAVNEALKAVKTIPPMAVIITFFIFVTSFHGRFASFSQTSAYGSIIRRGRLQEDERKIPHACCQAKSSFDRIKNGGF